MIRLSQATVYVLASFCVTFANATMFTTYVVYYVDGLHLTPFRLLMVGTVLEVVYFMAEGPTGAFADTFGRKRSIVIGTFVLGLSFLFEGLLPGLFSVTSLFFGLLLAEGIRAIGEAFFSGARQAWISDEVSEAHLGTLFLRAATAERLGGAAGIVLSVVVTNFHFNWGYVTGGFIYLGVCLFLLLSVRESGFRPRDDLQQEGLRQITGTWMQGVRTVRRMPPLWGILLVSLFIGAASEGVDRLWGVHFMTDVGFPVLGHWNSVIWFGVLAFLADMVGAGAAAISSRFLNTDDGRNITPAFMTMLSLRIGLIAMFALVHGFVPALLLYLGFTAVNSLFQPLYEVWKVQHIPPNVRATVMSMVGQTDALGQSGGGPIVGAIGSRYTIRAALIAAALFLTPALGAFTWFRRLERASRNIGA